MERRQASQLLTPLYFVGNGRFDSLGTSYVEVMKNETTCPLGLADIRSVSGPSQH